MRILLHIAALLTLLASTVACNQQTGGGAPARDRTADAEELLADPGLQEVDIDSLMGYSDQAYMPAVLKAYVHYPDYKNSIAEFHNLYYHPDADIPLDIPELLVLLGALDRAGYTPLPTEIYSAILMKRLFAMDASLLPDPTKEDPVGVDYDLLLADAYNAIGDGTRKDLRALLDATFGKNPAQFRARDSEWVLRLLKGEVGEMQADPGELFHRACMAAVMLDHQRVKPAFDGVADDPKTVYDYRFSAASASYLMSAGTDADAAQYRARVFGDSFIARIFSWPAYRLLAQHKDPVTYAAIQEALAKLPAKQHIDYGEFLALYGKPADLERVIALIEDPLTPVDLKLTEVRSPILLNPDTKDLLTATQHQDALDMRLAKDEMLRSSGEDEERSNAPGKLTPEEVDQAIAADQDTAEELNVPRQMLHDKRYTEAQLKARRLWWLRSFPIADIEAYVVEKLRKGSEEEQVVALRILGMYGGADQLGYVGQGLDSKHKRVKVEAAAWYLALKYKLEGYPPERSPGATEA